MILCISFSRQPPPVVLHQSNEVHGNRHVTSIEEVGQNCPAKFTAKSSDGSEYTSDSESSMKSEDPSIHASANFESGCSSGSSLKSTSGESDSAEVGEENIDHQGDGDVMKQLIDLRDIKPLVDSSGQRVVVGEGSNGKAFLGNYDGTIVIVKTMTATEGNILSTVAYYRSL